MRKHLFAGTALAVMLAAASVPLDAQVADGSASLDTASTAWKPDYGDAVGYFSSNPVQAAFGDLSAYYGKDAKATQAKAQQVLQTAYNTPGLSKEKKAEIVNLAFEGAESAGDSAKWQKWSRQFATLLETVNMIDTAGQSLGYVAEGDFLGAAGVLVQENTKDAMAATGVFAGSWFPGGQFLGALAGEFVHETYIKKAVENFENAKRNKAYAEKYVGKPWLRPQLFIRSDGMIIALDPDQYLDKDGLIKRRPPAEQAAYEKQAALNSLNSRTWNEIERDRAAGKIGEDQYGKLKAQWLQRDRTVRWSPLGVGSCDAAAVDPEVIEYIKLARQMEAGWNEIKASGSRARYNELNQTLTPVGHRIKQLWPKLNAKYSTECLKSIAASQGRGPAKAGQDPAPANGSGVVKNADGSRLVLTTGKDADGNPVKVWTTYDKDGRVKNTRIER